MNKAEKTAAIAELQETFTGATAAFFADYKGLTVEQVNDLRRRLRPLNVKVRVVKNNLARRAVANASADTKKLLETTTGPTMVAFTFGDPAAVAKELQKFAEENDVFGVRESLLNEKILTVGQIIELSKLPSREVLIARLLGALNAPVTNFVGVLAAVPRSLVQVLAAIAEQKEGVEKTTT